MVSLKKKGLIKTTIHRLKKGFEATKKNIPIPRIRLKPIVVKNRIPKDFFLTKGRGESDITIHAGSYHLALKDAGIEMCNIITYSSILPKIATETKKPKSMIHGSVMETIMAVVNSEKGERITAGIIYGWLYERRNGKKFGGLVSEYSGNYSREYVENQLKASIHEVYYNGFSEKYELKDLKIVLESFIPKKRYGTALVALCFTNYLILTDDENKK